MIKILRTNSFARNAVLYFVVLLMAAYVLVALGEAPTRVVTDTVTTVGGQTVQLRDIINEQEAVKNQFRQLNISDEQIVNIVPGRIFTEALIAEGADRAKILVSDEELRDFVIRSRTRADGTYVNNEDYISFANRNWGNVKAYESFLREQVLQKDKFKLLFNDAVFVSETEIKKRFEEQNKKIDVDYVIGNVFSVREQSKIEDEDLKAFFDKNKDEFMTGDLRQIDYVYFENRVFGDAFEPTEESISAYYEENKDNRPYSQPERARVREIMLKTDERTEAEAIELANKIKTEIENGLDFVEAVKTYSEDEGIKRNDGDRGLVSEGQYNNFLGEAWNNTVFSTELNQIAGPIKSNRGIHIVKVENKLPAKTQTLEEARPQIVNILKSQEGKILAQNAAAQFTTRLTEEEGVAFADVAKEMELEVIESDFFDQTTQSRIGGKLSNQSQVKNKVFAATEPGQGAELVDVGIAQVVFQYKASQEPQLLDFEKDRGRVKNMASSISGKLYLTEKMNEIKAKMEADPEKPLADIMADYEFFNENQYRAADGLNAAGFPFQLSRAEVTFEDLYGMTEGAFVGPKVSVANPNDVVLARVRKRHVANFEELEDQRAELVASIRNDGSNDLITSFLNELRMDLDPNHRAYDQIVAATQGLTGQD